MYEDDSGKIQYDLETLDLAAERRGIRAALEGTGVDVMFDFCTRDRLDTFLSRGQAKVLHYSGHGHPDYLAVEDGRGKMHRLMVKHLEEWIKKGGDCLQLVFVSACHSRAAGEAFCKAVVKHVVCIRDDMEICFDAASEFTKGFYQALANGKSVLRAFHDGKSTVKTSSLIDRSVADGEVDKFILLPEGDESHDHATIFDRDEDLSSPSRNYTAEELQLLDEPICGSLPRPPPVFQGRQADMYNVLTGLQMKTRPIVRVTGPKGVGKHSVIAAVCQHIQERKCIFKGDIEFLAWLDVDGETGEIDYSSLLDEDIFETSPNFLKVHGKLNETRTALIVDARRIVSDAQLGHVEGLLRDIVRFSHTT